MTTQILERVKVIKPGDGRTLDQLDLNVGDLVGFYVRYNVSGGFHFFILTRALSKIERHLSSRFGDLEMPHLDLVFRDGEQFNRYRMRTNGKSLQLESPDFRHPVFCLPTIRFCEHHRLTKDHEVSAYAGEENVLQALRETSPFEFYASWLENGGLI